MIKILISHCLLGENCKWNGRNNARDLLISIQDKVEYIPVCAEVFGGLELLRFLDIEHIKRCLVRRREVTGCLTAYPACRHIGDFTCRNETVHILIEIDGGLIPVDSDTLFELDDLAEDVIAEPFQGFLCSC